MRRLHSWPSWVLRAVVRYQVPGGIIADAWIELHVRGTEEASRACERIADDETGPYLVAVPPGMH